MPTARSPTWPTCPTERRRPRGRRHGRNSSIWGPARCTRPRSKGEATRWSRCRNRTAFSPARGACMSWRTVTRSPTGTPRHGPPSPRRSGRNTCSPRSRSLRATTTARCRSPSTSAAATWDRPGAFRNDSPPMIWCSAGSSVCWMPWGRSRPPSGFFRRASRMTSAPSPTSGFSFISTMTSSKASTTSSAVTCCSWPRVPSATLAG